MANKPLLRAGVQELLRNALVAGGVVDATELAVQLEEACMNNSQIAYAEAYSTLCKMLPEKHGEFLESTLATQIAEGRVSVNKAVSPKLLQGAPPVGHTKRRLCKSLFYSTLAKDPRFDDEAKRREYATAIERGCYNAAIARCRESADAYPRRWECPMFVNIYSACCSHVASNLDPTGSVARSVSEGKPWALDQLASGVWPPESLGMKTAAELCPQADQAERDRVMHRLKQRVDEKTSALFRCPRCHKRNHTYRLVQIGAGDEPSTFMCTCKECGQNYEGFA